MLDENGFGLFLDKCRLLCCEKSLISDKSPSQVSKGVKTIVICIRDKYDPSQKEWHFHTLTIIYLIS